jgi:uncharacterized membrane protein
MSFTPILSLPLDLALHLWAALLAVLLGPVALYRRRRDRRHKVAGYAWVVAMALVALSSFSLTAGILPVVAGFGLIHLLSVWVLWQLWRGVDAARSGQLRRHKATMRGLYWGGLMVAGIFTLLPGRVLNEVLFAETPEAGYVAIALGAAALAWINLRQLRRARIAVA